jgi:MoaA/NifB/PqqE/SkfB family radical SAM enzyme
MFKFENVKRVHLEMTDKCNAACPMCPRLDSQGRPNLNLHNTEITLADAKAIFTPEVLRHLDQIYLCGNFGDPMAARDTLEVLEYFRSENPTIRLGMHTNGSARPASWWSRLGSLMSQSGDYCKFALDGLEDTNHLYRRNTRWTKIMESVEAYISAGGRAHWEFLIFRHNQHQVEQAREMATRLGFDVFFAKKTSRFLNYETGRNEPYPVYDGEGKVLYQLEPPEEEKYVNPVSRALEKAASGAAPRKPTGRPKKKKRTSSRPALQARPPQKKIGLREPGPRGSHLIRDHLQAAEIDCMALREQTVYVSAGGLVFPCCFLGGQVQFSERGPDGDHIARLMRVQGDDAANAKKKPLAEIVNGPWFGAVSDSWSKPTIREGKLGTCARQCGTGYRPFDGEYADAKAELKTRAPAPPPEPPPSPEPPPEPEPVIVPPLSKTFCVMPWINLSTETNGNCKICCVVMSDRYVTRQDGTPYSLQSSKIEEIWNSDYMMEVRRKKLAGEKVDDCSYCYAQEESGCSSPRQDYNRRWLDAPTAESASASAKNDGRVDELPRSLEPRPGTACNLRCNTCWPMSSSRIEIERRKILSEGKIQVPDFLRHVWERELKLADASDFDWAESDTYLENFRKCLPGLKRLYFTGGEPTLNRSNIRILEELALEGRKDVMVSFTTNLTLVNPRLLEVLGKFRHVELTGSLDGTGDVNGYIRYPSRWETVSGNLIKLNSLGPRVWVAVMSVVQAMNVLSIVDLYRWVSEEIPGRPVHIIPTVLQSPDFLRLDILPEDLKERAAGAMDRCLREVKLSDPNRASLTQLRGQLGNRNPDAAELRAKFLEYVRVLDEARGTSFDRVLPGFRESFSRPN